MTVATEQVLLRLTLSNVTPWHTGAMYEAIVGRARHDKLAGATVLGARHGYVARGRILGEHPGALVPEHPVVVEIVERREAIDAFLAGLEPMLAGHAVGITFESVRVVAPGGPRQEGES